MKTFFKSLFIFWFFFPATIYSQSYLGIRAGYTSSTWVTKSSSDSHTMGRLSGFTFGVPLELRVSNLFSIQPELSYISKGGHDLFDSRIYGFNIVQEQTVRINYVEASVLAKFSFRNGNAKLDILLGPSIAYALDGFVKSKSNINGQIESDKESINFKDDEVNRIDISMNIGIGVSFPFGMNRAFFDFRYQAGLSNIAAPANNGNTHDFTVRDNTIQLAIGVMFPLHFQQKGAVLPKPQK